MHLELACMLPDRSIYCFNINEVGLLGQVAYEYPQGNDKGIPVQCEVGTVKEVLEKAIDIWTTTHLKKDDLKQLVLSLLKVDRHFRR